MNINDLKKAEKVIKTQLNYINWKLCFCIIILQVVFLVIYLRIFKNVRKRIYNIIILNALNIYMLILIQITISGRDLITSKINLVPFIRLFKSNNISERMLLYYILNIMLFIPYGILLRLYKFIVLKKRVLICFFTSLSIEFIQFVTCTGFFEIDDIIFNTFGGWLGGVIVTKLINNTD